MTTPDPSREAFLRWFAESGMTKFQETAWAAWQAAMAHKGAEGGGPKTPAELPQTRMDACSDHGPNHGWQPLETAPSYTTILVLGTSGMVVAYKDSYGDWKADGVDVTYDMAYTVLQIGKLTHWAPLPAAPKQEGST